MVSGEARGRSFVRLYARMLAWSLLAVAVMLGAVLASDAGEREHLLGQSEATPVEVCVAFEALGRHAVPGPWVETAAYLPVALGREVEAVATVAVPPHVPYALDADVADEVYLGVTPVSEIGPRHGSVDRTRHLFAVAEGSVEYKNLVACHTV